MLLAEFAPYNGPTKRSQLDERFGGFVYVLTLREHGLYKIGYTISNVVPRLNDIRHDIATTASGRYGCILFHAIPCRNPFQAEKTIHRCCSSYRVFWEWFKLPDNIAFLLKGIKEIRN